SSRHAPRCACVTSTRERSHPQRGTVCRDVNREGTPLRTCALGVEGGAWRAEQLATSGGAATGVLAVRDASGQRTVAHRYRLPARLSSSFFAACCGILFSACRRAGIASP